VRKVSASFLKKRSKKLLFIEGVGADGASARRTKSFLVLFFKKEPLSFCLARKAWMPAFAGMTFLGRWVGASVGRCFFNGSRFRSC
jgi:hypothetical protein